LRSRIDGSRARLIDANVKLVGVEELALGLSGVGVISTNEDRGK